jgi:hypothetical protein
LCHKREKILTEVEIFDQPWIALDAAATMINLGTLLVLVLISGFSSSGILSDTLPHSSNLLPPTDHN